MSLAFLLRRRPAFLRSTRCLSTSALSARVDVPVLGEIEIPTGLHM
jgi:hypothetical protein